MTNKFLVTIKHDGCIKCSGCASVCPVDALELVGGKIEFYPEKCIGAGACVRICPSDVVTLTKLDEKK